MRRCRIIEFMKGTAAKYDCIHGKVDPKGQAYSYNTKIVGTKDHNY